LTAVGRRLLQRVVSSVSPSLEAARKKSKGADPDENFWIEFSQAVGPLILDKQLWSWRGEGSLEPHQLLLPIQDAVRWEVANFLGRRAPRLEQPEPALGDGRARFKENEYIQRVRCPISHLFWVRAPSPPPLPPFLSYLTNLHGADVRVGLASGILSPRNAGRPHVHVGNPPHDAEPHHRG